MIIQKIFPEKDLQSYITGFSIQKIDAESRKLHFPTGRCALPDTNIRMAFHFTDTLPWIETAGKENVSQPAFNIRGYQMKPFVFNTDSEVNVLTVEFTPFGFRNLFGIPTSKLGSYSMNLKEFVKDDLVQIEDRLFSCQTYSEKIDFINRFVKSKIQIEPETERAARLHQMIKKNPAMSVRMLAASTFMSERTLRRFFMKHFGLAPKQYLRLYRFEQTISLMKKNHSFSLTEIAYQMGYFDQAHFTNEIKAIAGKIPSEILKML